MYLDCYLRFVDAEQAASVLYDVAEDGQQRPRYQNIDVIGVLYEPQDPVPEGQEQPEPVPLAGWHVNVRLVVGVEDVVPLEPHRVYPRSPRRVWL